MMQYLHEFKSSCVGSGRAKGTGAPGAKSIAEAVHCSAFHNASREDALELLQSAQSAAGALLVQLERDLMGIAAALLTEAGVADRWEEAGVTIAELSEQLLMSAKGIKATVDTLAAYRERMLTAIRIVMRSPEDSHVFGSARSRCPPAY